MDILELIRSRRSWFLSERLSPTLVTNIAGSSTTGHLLSQIPQPIQSSVSMTGATGVFTVPSGSLTSVFTSFIALGEVGQCSSQTMQGVPKT